VGGTCQPLVAGACATLGDTCSTNAQCCSMNCQGGRCAATGGACAADGDLCFKAADCCSSICTIAAGKSAGTCGALIGATGSGGCHVDGEPCADGTSCCSHLCITTSTGGHVCQVASGCKIAGDVCTPGAGGTDNCCNGGTCTAIAGTNPPIGTCHQGAGLVPEGGACGGVGDAAVSARQDCDCSARPRFDCCKPDSNGIQRCFGSPASGNCPTGYDGTPQCCIPAGEKCSFSAECCGGTPCLPDAQGVLRCLPKADGGVTCQPTGAECVSTGDCCAGLTCNIPPGASKGTCGVYVPTGSDAGTCAQTGQGCTSTTDCCVGLTCYGPGGSNQPCAAGQAGCSCYGIIL
jgi:hypothetical protein